MARKLKQEQQYQLARQLWDQGDLEGAEAAFRKLLRKDSTDSAALYDLGVMLLQKGAAAEAAEHLRKASLLLPKFAPAFNNLGLAQQMSNQREEALASFTRAITIEQGYTSALFNRAMLHKEIENWDAALSDIEAVLRKEPNAIDAIVARGQVLAELERHDEAQTAYEEAMTKGAPEHLILVDIGNLYFATSDTARALEYYERALVINPKNAKALYQKGLILLKEEKPEEAINLFKQSAAADPSFAKPFLQAGKQLLAKEQLPDLAELLAITTVTGREGADIYTLQGRTLSLLDRYQDAIAAFDKALALNPDDVVAMAEKSNCLRQFERYDEAQALLEQVLTILKDDPVILADLGSLFRQKGDYDAAYAAFDKAIAINDKCANAWSNKGQALFDQGRWEDAKVHYQRALDIIPDAATAKFNLGLCNLVQGNLAEGWDGYEWRLDSYERTSVILEPEVKHLLKGHTQHLLSAEQYAGKTVLVVEEQGIGDRVMFASTLADLMRTAKSVTILTTERLTELYQRSFPGIQTALKGDFNAQTIGAQFDIIILQASLCYAFRRMEENFPRMPYLIADEAKAAKWRERIGHAGKKLIGVSWRGGATHLNRTGRSLTLSSFDPILSRDDVILVNLQFGDTRAEIADVENKTGRKIISFDQKELYNLDDLTALIHALDRVVTVQNTNVHICGAIGKRCDALLPHVPEWRYGLDEHQMRWYGSVRLHRRDANTDPAGIIKDIAQTI